MRFKFFLFLAGLLAWSLAACSAGDSKIVEPGNDLGTLSGSVTIGPLCPVQPCTVEIGDTYSSRQLRLQSQDSEDILVSLNQDGTFQAEAPVGEYQVDLTICEHIGCSSALPVFIEIFSDKTSTLSIDIDTGIRSPVQGL